jgi:hypothetical protein
MLGYTSGGPSSYAPACRVVSQFGLGTASLSLEAAEVLVQVLYVPPAEAPALRELARPSRAPATSAQPWACLVVPNAVQALELMAWTKAADFWRSIGLCIN